MVDERETRTVLTGIEQTLAEIKPQVRDTHDGLLVMRADMKNFAQRVGALEAKVGPHLACRQEARIVDIEKDTRTLITRIEVSNAGLGSTESTLQELKASKTKLTYWLLGVAMLAISGLIGWVVTVTTLQADVSYLSKSVSSITTTLAKTHNHRP